jgi:hypothetical protein
MKTISLLSVILFIFFKLEFSFAQENYNLGKEEIVPIGKNLINDSIIYANKQVFPFNIFKIENDTVNNEVFIITRETDRDNTKYKNKGALYSYNSNLQKTSFLLPLTQQFELILTDSTLILTNEALFGTVYNRKTTTKISSDLQSYQFLNKKYNIGVYMGMGKFKWSKPKNPETKLVAINLLNKKIIWETEPQLGTYINTENNVVNDSVFVLSNSNSISKFNIFKGQQWSAIAKSNQKDNVGAITKISSQVIAEIMIPGAGTSLGAMTPSNTDIFGLHSNIIIDNHKIYYASLNNLVCLNENNGAILWATPLQEADMSASQIYLYKNTIFLISSGVGYKVQRTVKCGKSFIGCFDLSTGNKKYLVYSDEKQILKGVKIANDKVYILYPDNIVQYDCLTGESYPTTPFKMKTKSDFDTMFNENPFYSYSQERKGYLEPLNPNNIYIRNKKEASFYVFSPDLNKYEIINENKALHCVGIHSSGIKYIYNEVTKSAYLIDKTGQIISELKMGLNIEICGNSIIENNETAITILNLTPYIKIRNTPL